MVSLHQNKLSSLFPFSTNFLKYLHTGLLNSKFLPQKQWGKLAVAKSSGKARRRARNLDALCGYVKLCPLRSLVSGLVFLHDITTLRTHHFFCLHTYNSQLASLNSPFPSSLEARAAKRKTMPHRGQQGLFFSKASFGYKDMTWQKKP